MEQLINAVVIATNISKSLLLVLASCLCPPAPQKRQKLRELERSQQYSVGMGARS